MAKRLVDTYTFDASAQTVAIPGYVDLMHLLLITNVTDNIIIYNFTASTKGASVNYNSSSNVTTITLTYDTTSMSDDDVLQIYIDKNEVQIEPSEPFKDPVDRLRIANPTSIIDTDFEYSLQPTKWETIQTQNEIPSVYQNSNEPAFTTNQIVSIASSTVISSPTSSSTTYDSTLESLYYDTVIVADGNPSDSYTAHTVALNTLTGSVTVVGSATAQGGTSSFSLPGGLQENDVVVYFATADSGTPSTPSTYTQIISDNSSVDSKVAYKVMGATPDTTITGLDSGADVAHSVVVFRGIDTSDVLETSATASSTNVPNPPNITTLEDGCLILALASIDDDRFGLDIVAPMNFTLVAAENNAAPTGNPPGNNNGGSSLGFSYYVQSTAGSINPSEFGFLDSSQLTPNITLPFSVTVLGQTTNQVELNQDGVLFFNTAQGTTTGTLANANYVNGPHLKFFAQAMQLAKVGSFTRGTSPNREFIIKYEAQDATADASARGNTDLSHTAFIEFNEGSNDILVHYFKSRSDGVNHLSDGSAIQLTWNPDQNTVSADFNTGYIVRDSYLLTLDTVTRNLVKVTTTGAATPPFAIGQPITLKETKDTVYLDSSQIIVQVGTDVGAGITEFYLPLLAPEPYTEDQKTDYTIIYTGGFYYTAEIPYTKVESIASSKQVRITFSSPPSLFLGSTIYVVDSSASTIDWIGSFRINKVISSTEFEYLALKDTNYPTTATLSGINTKIYARNTGAAQHRYYDGGVQISPESYVPNSKIIRQTRPYFRYQSGKGIQYSSGVLFKPTYDIASIGVSSENYVETNNQFYKLTIETEQYHGFAQPGTYRPGADIKISGLTVSSGANNYNISTSVSAVPTPKIFEVNVGVGTLTEIPTDLTPGGLGKVEVESWNDAKVRAGLFDDQNGLFMEYDGQDLYAVRRTSTQQIGGLVSVTANETSVTGTNTKFKTQLSEGDKVVFKGTTYVVSNITSDTSLTISPDYKGPSITNQKFVKVTDLRTKSSEFNIDKLDGTGPSGYTFDASKMQMIYIDYSWYGAGKIRYGMRGLDGNVFYFHEYLNNNVNTEAYMRSGNLPGRFEINTDSLNGKIQSELSTSDTELQITYDDGVMIPNKGTVIVNNEYMEYTKSSQDSVAGITTLSLDNRNIGFLGTGNTSASINDGWISYNQNCSPVLSHWGVSVIMDGGFDEDKSYLFTASTDGTDSIAAGTEVPLISIRLAPSVDYGIPSFFGIRNLINRSSIALRSLGVVTDGQVQITLKINPECEYYQTESNWNGVGNGSISQYADHTQDASNFSISSGDIVAQFFTDEGSNRLTATYFDLSGIRDLGNSILGGPNVYPDGPDVLVVTAKNLGQQSCNVASSIRFNESQG